MVNATFKRPELTNTLGSDKGGDTYRTFFGRLEESVTPLSTEVQPLFYDVHTSILLFSV